MVRSRAGDGAPGAIGRAGGRGQAAVNESASAVEALKGKLPAALQMADRSAPKWATLAPLDPEADDKGKGGVGQECLFHGRSLCTRPSGADRPAGTRGRPALPSSPSAAVAGLARRPLRGGRLPIASPDQRRRQDDAQHEHDVLDHPQGDPIDATEAPDEGDHQQDLGDRPLAAQ